MIYLFYLFKYTLWQTEMFWKLKWCHDAEINVTSADMCAIRRSITSSSIIFGVYIFYNWDLLQMEISIKRVINWDFHLAGSCLTLLLKCGVSMRMSITGTWFGPLWVLAGPYNPCNPNSQEQNRLILSIKVQITWLLRHSDINEHIVPRRMRSRHN